MNEIDIDSIFSPSDSIKEPKWFAGRGSDIQKALQSLTTPGASMLVYGERGSGKSSFVEMVKLLASGNSDLLFRLNLQKRYFPEKFRYKVICTDCNSQTNSTAKVLQSLITSPFGVKSIISSRIDKIEKVSKDKILLNFLNFFNVSGASETTTIQSYIKEDSIFETFTNLILAISKDVLNPDEGLLIVVDEFDLVQDSSEMASLIKTLSQGKIKFLLSGIAESYESLLQGHQSVRRQLIYGRINISLMTDEEIAEIFKLVELNTKNAIRFEESFVKEVIEKSNRYPYFIQLFGKLALEEYYSEKGMSTPMIIHNKHLSKGIKNIGLYEEEMERGYNEIVKDNPLKELIIKFIAKQTANKISDEEILSDCYKNGIRQPHPKNTLTSLLGHRDPHFLIRDRNDSNYLYFTDKLFKTFVHSREPELLRVKDGKYIIPSSFLT